MRKNIQNRRPSALRRPTFLEDILTAEMLPENPDPDIPRHEEGRGVAALEHKSHGALEADPSAGIEDNSRALENFQPLKPGHGIAIDPDGEGMVDHGLYPG